MTRRRANGKPTKQVADGYLAMAARRASLGQYEAAAKALANARRAAQSAYPAAWTRDVLSTVAYETVQLKKAGWKANGAAAAGQPSVGDVIRIGETTYIVERSIVYGVGETRSAIYTGWGVIRRLTKSGAPTGRDLDVKFSGSGIAMPLPGGKRSSQSYVVVKRNGHRRNGPTDDLIAGALAPLRLRMPLKKRLQTAVAGSKALLAPGALVADLPRWAGVSKRDAADLARYAGQSEWAEARTELPYKANAGKMRAADHSQWELRYQLSGSVDKIVTGYAAALRRAHKLADYELAPIEVYRIQPYGARVLSDVVQPRMKANAPRKPAKAEVQRLVEALAIYRHSHGAPVKVQDRLYKKYEAALAVVLKKLEARVLSSANQADLEYAANLWWNSRAFKGSGVDW